MRSFTGMRAAMALAMTAALSGCFAPSPSPSPVPAPSPITTASPTQAPDPMADVVALVARPLALELRDADGDVVASLDYMSSPADAVAVLTDLFDAPPVDEEYPATNHTPPGVSHAWDEFVLDERRYDEERRVGADLDYIWPRFAVRFEAATARGFDLTTSTAAHVGEEFVGLAQPIDPELWTCSGWAIEVVEISRTDQAPARPGVGLSEWAYDPVAGNHGQRVDHVVSIHAPVEVATGCV